MEESLRHLTVTDYGEPPQKQNEHLQSLGSPHTTSFNYMVNAGLDEAIKDISVDFELPNKDRINLNVLEASISHPTIAVGTIGARNPHVYPSECRQRGATYRGKFQMRLGWSINGEKQIPIDQDLGDIPIMLKSNRCHLENMSPKQLVGVGEHEEEWGGYFIIKGLERLVRMLLSTRSNYPIAVRRPGWKGKGTLFSDVGVFMRCVKSDQTSVTNILHFVTDGSAKLKFSIQQKPYYIPLMLILKALVNYADHYIYSKLIEGYEEDLYYIECIQNMLRGLHQEGYHNQSDCKKFIGGLFRVEVRECAPWFTDEEVTDYIIKRSILISLEEPKDKFDTLVFMTKKLFTFARSKCKVENNDAVMMQEVLLGGHLYLQVLKERILIWLRNLRYRILKKARETVNFNLGPSEMNQIARVNQGSSMSFGNNLEMFISTGNLVTKEVELMQSKGLTIVPENINRMRYMSHFRAVHRGSFFLEMRTTEARQLLPDAWGFICPVHTPDGPPCGLLNHLTMDAVITDFPDINLVKNIPKCLLEYGMIPLHDTEMIQTIDISESYSVLLDGKFLGYVSQARIDTLVENLRMLKIDGKRIPFTTEIVLVPIKKVTSQYPGLFLFTGAARMMRPLRNLIANKIEYVGTFEQVYLEVCIKPQEYYKGVTTHMELSKTSFLSNLAQLIPMPDCNQSPRNMYQCQMGKQTMGTPCHNYDLQAETKLYRLQTPTAALFRPYHYKKIGLDHFSMGTNAIVAVISYTGYDMEDAIVINKCSEERGFAHGSIYKSEFCELDDSNSYFCRDPSKENLIDYIDSDGLPYIGRKMSEGEPLYCYYNTDESKYVIHKFKGREECYVNSVRLCGDFNVKAPKIACITYRVPRNPSVGDKFASRAGQKGICSQKWPAEDLPFTETGIVPDIIFNPHGFPSRMTIAMMIEIMAGKSASIHGLIHDATPFRFGEDTTAIDYFGKLLQIGGCNYYGTETMYSGIDGRLFEAQIFMGVVHYQRLRHMVSDKWQVRSTGPMDVLTRQPLKGRKRGGGVRFGEMERDALLSHGAAALIQDRLLNCSDRMVAYVCTSCHSLLGPMTKVTRMAEKANLMETKEICRFCDSGRDIDAIQIPYIYKFFVTQLASCGINVKIKCK
nr:DNA-directed RNA polymerase I subunit RPA2 [Onthophagus taurus]